MALFGRNKKHTIEVVAPVEGRVVSLDDVPDPVFAKRVLGDGFAVDPSSGRICSPVAGTLVLLPESRHAFALRTADGLEVLVHIGIDTVKLKGAGFSTNLSAGDEVAVGDVVIEVDMDAMLDVPSMMTPVIITNGDDFTVASLALDAAFGDPVLTVEPA